MATFTNNKGRTVTSALSNTEALTVCESLQNDFARDLARKARKYNLSEAQWYWVHTLALESVSPCPEPTRTELGDMAGVLGVFNTAKQHLKWPKIRLSVNGQEVCLSMAGERAKKPGTINVTDGRKFGENRWFGRIDVDGTFTQGRDCTEDVVALLKRFALAPAQVAAEFGRLTGSCCFCRKQLTDERSTAVGFGAICANNFGLSYPTLAEARGMVAA